MDKRFLPRSIGWKFKRYGQVWGGYVYARLIDGGPRYEQDRQELWRGIENVPAADWLLLSRNPERVGEVVPWTDAWPDNLWLGCWISRQADAQKYLAQLIASPAPVRFIWVDPLYEPLDLSEWIDGLDWVIVRKEQYELGCGTECHWIDDLKAQCLEACVAFELRSYKNSSCPR